MSTSDNDTTNNLQEGPSQAQNPAQNLERAEEEQTNLISIDDFARVQLRVGQILEAERLPKSEKLLRFKVDLGETRGPRQILAGIAKYYRPEDLIGRKVVVVANLKPAKLMGQVSEGMLLCASDEQGNLELLSPGMLVAAGSTIR